jgi:hypothetical protein
MHYQRKHACDGPGANWGLLILIKVIRNKAKAMPRAQTTYSSHSGDVGGLHNNTPLHTTSLPLTLETIAAPLMPDNNDCSTVVDKGLLMDRLNWFQVQISWCKKILVRARHRTVSYCSDSHHQPINALWAIITAPRDNPQSK